MKIYDYHDDSTREYNYVGPVHFINTVIEPAIGNEERGVGGDKTRWRIETDKKEIDKIIKRLGEEKLLTSEPTTSDEVTTVTGPMGVILEFIKI